VASAAVGFLGFVFGTEFVAMACQTFAAIVGSRLLLRRSEVRVMATDTTHLVGRFSFADTLRECFGLGERANPVIRVAGQNEIVDEVRQLVSRLKIGRGTPWLLDGDATFEMAPQADGIAPIGRQLRGVHSRSTRLHVRGTLAVAPLARYPRMRKQWLLVSGFPFPEAAPANCWCDRQDSIQPEGSWGFRDLFDRQAPCPKGAAGHTR
jgi:hypothetical protein